MKPLDPASYAQGLRDAAAMLDVDRQTIRLHAGEMTGAEMRAVLAVLAWKRGEIVAQADHPQASVGAQPPMHRSEARVPSERAPLPISATLQEASRLSGIGKTMLYELIHAGRVRAKKNGRITLVLVDSLREHIDNLPDWKADPPAR